MAKVREAIVAAIRKIEAKPSIPVGVYFGVYMVSWVVAALAATHLVDPKCRLLAWLKIGRASCRERVSSPV